MLYVERILKFFGKSSVVDELGQRYNQACVGMDLDENILPAIDNFIPNNVDPRTMLDILLPYIELGRGKDARHDNLTMPIDVRRTAAKYLIRTNGIRGTLKCLRVLFGWLGMTVTITKTFTNRGFDSGLGFDSDLRDFDSWCNVCMYIDMEIAGSLPLSQAPLDAISSIIRYNLPIGVTLGIVNYNGQPLVIVLDDFY